MAMVFVGSTQSIGDLHKSIFETARPYSDGTTFSTLSH